MIRIPLSLSLVLLASCASNSAPSPAPVEGPALEVPRYAEDDERPNTGGFVRDVSLASVERDGTTFTLMAWQVGDVLTLGAMTDGAFTGQVEWQLGTRGFRFDVDEEPRSGRMPVEAIDPPAGAAALGGDKAGFSSFSWTNVDLEASLWWFEGPAALSVTWRTEAGKLVRLPEEGAFAARRFEP
ncbi:MAG: hypothetical protein AAFP22_03430 [Planctomycetota bacterium]